MACLPFGYGGHFRWLPAGPDTLAWVLDSLDELVVKPVDGAGGAGIVIGPRASAAELAVLRERLQADPRGWMAQRPVALSTSPVLIGESLAPRHIDLRPFAVNDGEDVWLLPGGLTRVALPEGELVVNSSQGGAAACARTWPTSRWPCCARPACPPGTSPATCTPTRPPSPARPPWGEPRLGRVLGRLLAATRPDQRHAGAGTARGGGPGPGLRRHPAAQGHLPRCPGQRPHGDRGSHPAGLSPDAPSPAGTP